MSDTPIGPPAQPADLPPQAPQPVNHSQLVADVLQGMAQQSATLERCIAVNKARLFPVLAAAGIAVVEIFYCGEGDSGGVDDITCHGADNATVTLPEAGISLQSCNWRGDEISEQAHATLADAIEMFALDIIECRFAGWENNDGAVGTVKFCIETDTIELEHGTKVTSYDHVEF